MRRKLSSEDIASAIKGAGNEFSFDTVASGGIASSYQRSRIDEIAKQLGLRAEAPLWGVDQISYLQNLVSNHYRFILTSVSAEGLDRSWLGREIDQRSVLEIIRLSKNTDSMPHSREERQRRSFWIALCLRKKDCAFLTRKWTGAGVMAGS